MKVKSFVAASMLALASVANSAEVHLQLDQKSELDSVVREIVKQTLTSKLDTIAPNNNVVIVVTYHVMVKDNVCVYSVAMTGGVKDKNRIIIDKVLSPSDVGIGTTVNKTVTECGQQFGANVATVANNLFGYYAKLYLSAKQI